MVDAGFGEDVDPAIVGVVEEGYCVVHGRLVYSSWSPWWMTIDGKGLSESEEQRVETIIRYAIAEGNTGW